MTVHYNHGGATSTFACGTLFRFKLLPNEDYMGPVSRDAPFAMQALQRVTCENCKRSLIYKNLVLEIELVR